MKIKVYFILSEVLNFIMMYLLILSATWVWAILLKRDISIVLALGTLILLSFCYIARAYFKNVIVFVLSHLIMFPITIFVPVDILYRTVLVFMLIIITVLDAIYWLRDEEDIFPAVAVPLVIFPAISFLLSNLLHTKYANPFFFFAGVLFFILYYLRTFFDSAFELSIERTKNEKMPFKDIIRNDSKLFIPFVIFSFFVMIIAKFDFIDEYAVKAYMWGIKYVRIALVFIANILEKIINAIIKDVPIETDYQNAEELLDEMEAWPFMIVISNIINVLVILLCFFVFIKLIIAFVRKINIKRTHDSMTIEEEDMIEIRENIIREKKKKQNNLNKIRKKYKKTIEKKVSQGYSLKKSHTPRERAYDLKKIMNDDISELSSLYEKDRYGIF